MTFSKTDPNKVYEGLTRVWALIIYPGDSCPDNYISLIEATHIPCFLSPIHQPDDRYPDEYKVHRHLMIVYEGKKSDKQVLSAFSCLNGTKPFVIDSKIGYGRYLCHLDEDPKLKPIYSPSEVISFSGANYFSDIIDEEYRSYLIYEITDFIDSMDIILFNDLVNCAKQIDSRWVTCIKSNTSFIKTYLSSRKLMRDKPNNYNYDRFKFQKFLKER